MQNRPPIIRRSSLDRPTRSQIARRRAGVVAAVVLVLIALWQFWPAGGIGGTGQAGPGGSGEPTGSNPPPSTIQPGNPIKHVIFLVKENHSFDNYFGKYPGADGATEGPTLKCDQGFAPGPTVPLTPAPYLYPHDLGHAFVPGLTSIDGGKMDGFNCVTYGDDLTGYTQFDRKSLPAYWALADRFVLADHFFTSMYGPTFPEHLYTIAAQSYGIVDNKTTTDTPGNYCDDPSEHTRRFPIEDLTTKDTKTIMDLEDHFLADPANEFRIAAYWVDTRTCVNIPVLPDELQQAKVSWKYYANQDQWMNAMQAIKHVRFGPMWNKVQTPETILTDLHKNTLPAVSWLIPPEGNPNEHPGADVNICIGENWTVQYLNALFASDAWPSTAVVMVWDDFGGFYDHVSPPHYDVMGLGPRTPALIISPYTVAGSNPDGGSIDSTVYEFSSVLRFMENLHGLDPMTERDAQASPLAGAFDFTQPPRLDVPKLRERVCPTS
ncbi:MAG: alkaline phosphatase family protein [Actinomycetota bacterium]